MKALAPIVVGVALALTAFNAAADEGSWIGKVGVHVVDPTSDNGTLANGAYAVDIDTNARPTFTIERMLTPNWGVEVLAALPFQHEVSLNGVQSATIKHLPPTVSMQYHFMPEGKASPFLGVGLNYTWIYSESETGPLAGTDLQLSNSWGAALHAGIDFHLEDAWMISIDARWMDIDSTARLNGAEIGTVHVDPMAYGVMVGYRF